MDKLFGRLFSAGNRATPEPDFPNLSFGRYNDFLKSKTQRSHLRSAEASCARGDFLSSLEQFLLYLNDPEHNNVSFTRTNDKLEFQIIQGSKMVRGRANQEEIQAESEIAEFEKSEVVILRKLLEMNFGLKYCRFALKDNLIVLKFKSSAQTCNPDKMYDALKELASRADKLDDLLVDEFKSLKNIDQQHIEEISLAEKELKWHFLKKWIRDTLNDLPKGDKKKYAKLISYALLNLAYKIDYLLTPEGQMMDRLEKIHQRYFSHSNESTEEKNEKIIGTFEDILHSKKEDVFKGLYRVKATFGLGSKVDVKTVLGFVTKELNATNEEALEYPYMLRKNMLEYIAQYGLFYYRMNQPSSEIFHLAVELCNQDFFTALGHEPLIDPESGQLISLRIRERIREIEVRNRVRYPRVALQSRQLDFSELLSFLSDLYYQFTLINFQVKL